MDPLKLIPPERLNAVKKALAKAFQTKPVEDISPLSGGLSTAKVYKLIIDGHPFLLKLDAPMENEGTRPDAMETAANAGIAPPVFYRSPIEGITITRFIEGRPARMAFKTRTVFLSKLAEIIRSVHQLPPLAKEGHLEVTVDQLVLQFRHAGRLSGTVFDKCYTCYDLIKAHYPWEDTDKVFSHNDLHPHNIICDQDRIWIVDWDAAFQNDRYADLAVAANFYVNNDEEELIFLRGYFGEDLSEYQRARFFVMQQVCRLVYAMLMFRLADRSRPDGSIHDAGMQNATLAMVKRQLETAKLTLNTYDGQLLFGKALIHEVVAQMHLPRFASSLKLL